MNALIVSLLLALSTFGSVSLAQQRGLPTILPGCTDLRGRMIPTIVDEEVPTYAAAAFHPQYGPIIVINPNVAANFTPRFNAWVFLHECGHHRLGHVSQQWWPFVKVQNLQKLKELDADCYGMREAVRLGYIKTNDHFKEVVAQMIDWPTDPEHPSGVTRAKSLVRCLQERNPMAIR
jgi:hypothetical protein